MSKHTTVFVDADRCAGHGTCVALCPEVFELTDDGYAVALVTEVPSEHREAVQAAEQQCPTQAIVYD